LRWLKRKRKKERKRNGKGRGKGKIKIKENKINGFYAVGVKVPDPTGFFWEGILTLISRNGRRYSSYRG